MPHIHELYDFVVSAFIIHRDKVLLVHHRRYNEWLPLGGHIELNEDPEQALHREILEESGLRVKILATKPTKIAHPGVKPLLTPSFMDSHRISDTHWHIAFVYFAEASSFKVRLHEREHFEYGWFTKKQLSDKKLKLTKSIRFYCLEAFKASKRFR